MFLATLFGWITALAVDAAPAPTAILEHRRYRLDNGLDVVLHDDDLYPLVTLRVVYHVGRLHDPPGHHGTAHLLEHAVFDGGTRHLAADAATMHLHAAGASGLNANTRAEATVYLSTLPSNQIDVALWVESERMGFFEPRLVPGKLAREREIVTQESLQRQRGDDDEIAGFGLRNLMFPPGHPQRTDDRRSIDAIEIDDVAKMYDAHYGPGNATLIVAGALPDDIDARIERYFGSLSGGTAPVAVQVAPRRPGPRKGMLRSQRARVVTVYVGWETPAQFEPGDADAIVAAELLALGGGRPSGKRAAIADFGPVQASDELSSVFYVGMDGRAGVTAEAMQAELDGALRWIASGGFTDHELHAARRRAVLRVYRRLDTIEGRAEAMAAYVIAGKSPDWIAEDVARHEAVTRASVSAFVRDNLLGGTRYVTTVVPTGGAR